MAAVVELRGATKRFGAVLALDAIDLAVEPGETVVLVGPNGSGKTTLLQLLSGTLEPDAGDVLVCGHDVVRERRAARARTGAVLGGPGGWYPRLSGRANLEFFASLEALGDAASGAVDAALGAVGLAEAADRRVGGYSTGMRARLALARARLARPPVLLLDEPTAALDARSVREFRDSLRTDDRPPAVLLATHDAEEAVQLGDRVVALRAGRVARELRHDPGLEDVTALMAA
ncbi:MAG TPA: ABC transporter ATP-binding protein [Thermoleophilaceae bacterium]|jgi:ABC-type multidrug transport system ATPase subunit